MPDIFDKVTGVIDKGAGGIDSIASGDIAGAVSALPVDKFLMWGKILFWATVVMFGLVFIYKYKIQYKHRALVKQVKGGAVVDNYFTDVRIFKDERGKQKLQIAKGKKTCPVPDYNITSKMGKKDFFTLYEGDDGEIYAWDGISLSNNDGNLLSVVSNEKRTQLIDAQVMKAWRLEEMKLAESKYKKESFLQKYKSEIIIFFVVMGSVGIIWLVTKSIESMYINMAGSFREVAKNCLG